MVAASLRVKNVEAAKTTIEAGHSPAEGREPLLLSISHDPKLAGPEEHMLSGVLKSGLADPAARLKCGDGD